MSILIITDSISEYYIVFSNNHLGTAYPIRFLYIVDIFPPSGADPTYPPILLQSLRCSPLAVDHYSFMGHGLAFAALMLGWGGSDRE